MHDIFTDAGFNRPTFHDILTEQISQAKALFGDDIETDEKTPLGKFIRLIAHDLAVAYETLESVYYSDFPNTASGTSLDRLCVLKGIHRNGATLAMHEVKFIGTVGATVAGGFLVSTEDGTEFVLQNNITIEDGGTIARVFAAMPGISGNVPNGSIKRIVNPDAAISEITDSMLVEPGQDMETDYALRQRLTAAASQDGYGTADSIRAAILAVDGVRGCIVNEYGNGSFECSISASADHADSIAQAIFDKKPIGTVATGTDSGYAHDQNGTEHEMHFNFVATTPIYIKMTLRKTSKFSANGVEQIQENIVQKIGKLGIGDDVILSSLYQCIYSVEGVEEVTELSMSLDGNTYAANNISLTDSQIASASIEQIEVTAT